MTTNPIARLLLGVAGAALILAGCGKSDTGNTDAAQADAQSVAPPQAALPLATEAEASAAPAPAATDLPPPPAPIRYAAPAGDPYAYLDRAYGLRQALGDAPPDYTYDYDNERPWVWRTDDGYECVAEQLPDGSLRYYYYAPGDDQPYLVEDPDYSYGYSGGELTVIYDSRGTVISRDQGARQAEQAGRYLARAIALYAGSQRLTHRAVSQDAWSSRRQRFDQDQTRWSQDQDRDPDWRAYHQRVQDQQQSQWALERYRREAEAVRLAQATHDAAETARAAQALADASAQAQRHGQDIGRARLPAGQRPPPPTNAPASQPAAAPQPAPLPPQPQGPERGRRGEQQAPAASPQPQPQPQPQGPERGRRGEQPAPAANAPPPQPAPQPQRPERGRRGPPEAPAAATPPQPAPPAPAANPAPQPQPAPQPARPERGRRGEQPAPAANPAPPSAPAANPAPASAPAAAPPRGGRERPPRAADNGQGKPDEKKPDDKKRDRQTP